MSNTERSKDPMILFRSVIVGKNKKGGDRTQLYMEIGEAVTLAKELASQLITDATQKKAVVDALSAARTFNEKGVKIDLHVSKKRTKDGSREFDSAIAFVKAVTEGAPGARGQQRSFAPVPNTEMEAQIAALKAQLAAVTKQ